MENIQDLAVNKMVQILVKLITHLKPKLIPDKDIKNLNRIYKFLNERQNQLSISLQPIIQIYNSQEQFEKLQHNRRIKLFKRPQSNSPRTGLINITNQSESSTRNSNLDQQKQKSILLRPNSNVKIHQKRVKKVDFEYGQLNMQKQSLVDCCSSIESAKT